MAAQTWRGTVTTAVIRWVRASPRSPCRNRSASAGSALHRGDPRPCTRTRRTERAGASAAVTLIGWQKG